MNRSEKIFILFAMLTAVFINAEYAITRPASNALFISFFSAKNFPWVWLMGVPINLLAIDIYNRFLPKIGPLRMLIAFASLTIAINTLTSQWPQLIFFQFAWKDIYILLMFKQLWSMIHSTIPATRAKYLYGSIYGMGTLGAIAGSFIPSYLAVNFGSEKLLLFTLPLYLLLIFAYRVAFRQSSLGNTFTQDLTTKPQAKEAFSLIRNSPTLTVALLVVVFMQVSTGLMEYKFNTHLEMNIISKDLRTAYCGKLMGFVNLLSLGLQFVGTFLMVRFLGVKRSHFLIPVLLGGSALLSTLIPSFALISLSYVFLKAVDFSLFGVIREMLYIPLRLDEKYRAKAVIDVFAYRSSKAIVSLALILLQMLAGIYLLQITSVASLAIFALWLVALAVYFKAVPVRV